MDDPPPLTEKPSAVLPEIERIRSELNELKKRLPDRMTKIGAILGIVTAVVGGVKGGFDLYKWLTRAPRIAVEAGPSLSMEYYPSKSRIKLEFAFSVANYSDEPNIVKEIDARLPNSSSSSQDAVLFSSLDFTCSSGDARVPIPFPLPPGLPVTVDCTAESDMPERVLNLLTQNENRFDVGLHGRQNSQARMSFCFFLPSEVILEAAASPQSPVKRRFVNPQCA